MQEREDECDAVFEGDYTVLPHDMLFEFLPNCKPNGVTCEPVNNSVLIVKNEKDKQNLPGRAAVALELHCRGGNLQAPLGPQPVL